jgi:hypothetical protein
VKLKKYADECDSVLSPKEFSNDDLKSLKSAFEEVKKMEKSKLECYAKDLSDKIREYSDNNKEMIKTSLKMINRNISIMKTIIKTNFKLKCIYFISLSLQRRTYYPYPSILIYLFPLAIYPHNMFLRYISRNKKIKNKNLKRNYDLITKSLVP